ncbi:MAG: hypothetical protein DMD89_25340 [Candidatus Rokuibacteriota bacterium]|nr:MAG: hypothetical protein DMD89_25340 [Candidatus Rokubacteria bacterium]
MILHHKPFEHALCTATEQVGITQGAESHLLEGPMPRRIKQLFEQEPVESRRVWAIHVRRHCLGEQDAAL